MRHLASTSCPQYSVRSIRTSERLLFSRRSYCLQREERVRPPMSPENGNNRKRSVAFHQAEGHSNHHSGAVICLPPFHLIQPFLPWAHFQRRKTDQLGSIFIKCICISRRFLSVAGKRDELELTVLRLSVFQFMPSTYCNGWLSVSFQGRMTSVPD